MRTLDLFCGAAGGWTLGLHRAGIRTVAACEIDDWRREVYARRWPAVRMFKDVRDLHASDVADLGIDLIAGSPPCQDASAANARGRGVDGERTGLFWEALRLVRELRPRWVAFENVYGLVSRGLDRILDDLHNAGYRPRVFDISASAVGAPHLRRRIWIVANAGDKGSRPLARATHGNESADEGRAAEYDFVAGGVGESGGTRIVANAARYGCGQRRPGRSAPSGEGEREQALSPASLATREQVGRAGQPRQEVERIAADADETRLAQRQGERGNPREEQPTALGSFLQAWPHWHGGPPDLGRVDDGLPKGVARRMLAAYGDAIVPQIAEMIGRAILMEKAK